MLLDWTRVPTYNIGSLTGLILLGNRTKAKAEHEAAVKKAEEAVKAKAEHEAAVKKAEEAVKAKAEHEAAVSRQKQLIKLLDENSNNPADFERNMLGRGFRRSSVAALLVLVYDPNLSLNGAEISLTDKFSAEMAENLLAIIREIEIIEVIAEVEIPGFRSTLIDCVYGTRDVIEIGVAINKYKEHIMRLCKNAVRG